jgi:hypothetical protein
MNTPVRSVTVAHAEMFAQTQALQTTKPSSIKTTTPETSASTNYQAMCSMDTSAASIQSAQALKSSSQPSSSQSLSSQSSSSSKQSSSSQSTSSPPSQRSKGKSKKPVKVPSGRLHKGEDDPIQSFNRYSSLDEMDIDPLPTTSRPVSVSPRRGRRRSPVKHPP